MRRLGGVSVAVFVFGISANATADEDGEPTAADGVDLRVDTAPIVVERLDMRAPVSGAVKAKTAAPKSGPPEPAPALALLAGSEPGAAAEAEIRSRDYSPLPTSLRDLEERLVVKLNVGFAVDAGSTSGDPTRSGVLPDDTTAPGGAGFNDVRPYLLGDAVIGSRGLLTPSLNTYFLSRFAFQTESASVYNSLNNVYDSRGGRELLIYAGYAEIDQLGDPGSFASKLYLKAGRQFRYGASNYVANFDGVSAALNDIGYSVSAFVGRRASAFYVSDPGYMGGAGLVLRGEKLFGFPVDIAADYLFFTGAGKRDLNEDGQNDVSLTRHYFELSARTRLARTRVRVKARVVDNGDFTSEGAGLGRLGVQVRQPIGEQFLLFGEIEHKLAREVAYSFVSPAPQDVVDIARQLGVGLAPPEDATRVTLRGNYQLTRNLELYGFGRANIVFGDTDDGFNQSWFEGGAAVSARLMQNVSGSAQYKARFSSLDDSGNDPGERFDNTAGSGVESFHEISAEGRYSTGKRSFSGGAGLYYRIYSLRSPYAEIDNDGRVGGRADFDYWFTKQTRIKLAGEVAQPSPSFANELSTLFSLRAIGEFLF